MKLNNYFALPKKYFAEEMVGRHEKWTGHNESRVREEQRRREKTDGSSRGLNNQSGWYFESAVNMSVVEHFLVVEVFILQAFLHRFTR